MCTICGSIPYLIIIGRWFYTSDQRSSSGSSPIVAENPFTFKPTATRYNFAHLQWIGYRKYSTHDLQLPRDDAQFQHSLIKKGIPKPPKRSTMAYYHELDEWWVVYHVLSINTIRCRLFRGCQIILHCLLNVSEDSFGPIQSQEFNHSWINNDLSRSPLICTEPFDINLDRPHLMEVVVVVMVWAVVQR